MGNSEALDLIQTVIVNSGEDLFGKSALGKISDACYKLRNMAERHEPKKPNMDGERFRCSVCNMYVRPRKERYCHYCGQRQNWDLAQK